MFRFTIRELVLLTLVLAMGIGWWIDRRELSGTQASLAEYQLTEKHELGRQQDEKRLQDLLWKLSSEKAINEYGAPAPKPPLTVKESQELQQLYIEQERLIRSGVTTEKR